MIEALFWVAVASGIAGAIAGNRTAWLLLASVALCLTFSRLGVPFSFPLWLAIDVMIVALIVRPEMTAVDCVVIALFLPAWAFYLMDDQTRFVGTYWVVVAQLLLVFPAEPIRRRLVRLWRHDNESGDRMVMA